MQQKKNRQNIDNKSEVSEQRQQRQSSSVLIMNSCSNWPLAKMLCHHDYPLPTRSHSERW